MDTTERPIPALVPPQMAPTGDGFIMPGQQQGPGKAIPAPFAGLRWRLMSDRIGVRRSHVKP